MSAKSKAKHVAIYVTGWIFLVLGVLGLFLPILQGILFILIGLLILSSVSPWAERLLHRLSKRFPKTKNALDDAKSKASKVQSKISNGLKTTKKKTRKITGAGSKP